MSLPSSMASALDAALDRRDLAGVVRALSERLALPHPEGRLPYGTVLEILDDLPSLLHEARRAHHVQLKDLAKETGVSLSTIARIESGRGCTTAVAIVLMRWLDARQAGGSR